MAGSRRVVYLAKELTLLGELPDIRRGGSVAIGLHLTARIICV